MSSHSTFERIASITEDQWGLITRRQALEAGVPQTTLDRLTATPAVLERVAFGVYHLAGAPVPDHLELRAAWLQLEPGMPVWGRTPDQGVISYRSAAALYGLGHLPVDRHEFTVPTRHQSRRPDVRFHVGQLEPHEYIQLKGLPVTRPSRIASDLLYDREEPDAVAHIVADAIRGAYDDPGALADALSLHATRFGLRQGDGLALLEWLLELVGDPETDRWMGEARDHASRHDTEGSQIQQGATVGRRR